MTDHHMTEHPVISAAHLARFSDFLGKHTGLCFEQRGRGELARGLGRAAREFGFDDPVACIDWLMSARLSRRQIEILSIHLTVGETYFFREKRAFDALIDHMVPRLMERNGAAGGRLRIWSAACSTGEEPYTIAMVLDSRMHRLPDMHITIVATDLNVKALKAAEAGIYRTWALRNTPSFFKQTYFEVAGEGHRQTYRVKESIRKKVDFQYLNLAEPVYPSLLNNTNAMDIIFCRNVLMYFSPERAREVIGRLYCSLVPGGWLVTSPSDLFCIDEVGCFQREPFYNCAFVRCESKDITPPAPPVAAPPPGKREKQDEKPRGDAYQRAQDLYLAGNYPAAAAVLRDAGGTVGGDNPPGGHFALAARCYANMGRLATALEWCEKALGADKLNPDYHYLRAVILQEQGDEEGAVLALKRSLFVAPDFVPAHFSLGNMMMRRGEANRSRVHFQQALDRLQHLADDTVVLMDEGMSAGRLRAMIRSLLDKNSEKNSKNGNNMDGGTP